MHCMFQVYFSQAGNGCALQVKFDRIQVVCECAVALLLLLLLQGVECFYNGVYRGFELQFVRSDSLKKLDVVVLELLCLLVQVICVCLGLLVRSFQFSAAQCTALCDELYLKI